MRKFAEHLTERDDHRPYVRQHFVAGSGQVTVAEVNYFKPCALNRKTPELVLSLHQRTARVRASVGGQVRATHTYQPGEFDLTPPETGYASERYDPVSGIAISIPTAVMSACLSGVTPDFRGDFGKLHDSPHRSDVVTTLCRQLVAEAEQGGPMGALYADTLVNTVLVELLRCARLQPRHASGPRGALSATTMSRIDEQIDANPMASVALRDLAAAAEMPLDRFARVFKRQTGQTAYQYALRRRLDRARSLVEGSTRSLAQIAYECGFSSQAHMTDLFRAKLGVTPGALRA